VAANKLTAKQQLFVDEYLIDLNAAAAYRRAGYQAKSDHVASVNAAALMAKHGIQAAIAAAQQARAQRVEITQDWVVKGLKGEAEYRGEGSSHAARVAAYKHLGEHLGMFERKLNVRHTGGITHHFDDLSDQDVDARIHELETRLPRAPGGARPETGADQPA
jgi:phage terminase small subunit